MFLSDAALKNRTTVWVLVFLIVVAGAFSYVTLPRESSPDVPIPYVLVTTTYEGVSPEDMESSVTMKIEKKLTGIKGVKEISSTSSEGVSLITLEFQPDIEIENALQYVRDKVDLAKPDLPADAEEPSLSEINIAEFPIMIVSISGEISPVRLKAIAETLQDYVEMQPGVLEAEIVGDLEREIRLEFDPDKVAAYGISIPELVSLIPSENVNISAGGLETPGTRFNVRVPAEFATPTDIDSLMLTSRMGRPIYLKDVATIMDGFKDRESFSRLDGRDSISLQVKKRVGSNILDVATRVRTVIDEARKKIPAGVDLEITMDQSSDVVMMVSDLENNILSGLVLVVAVLMLAMGLRTSIIVAMAIPLSMLASFAILQLMGITMNMIVLFSLILALGMLVDNAIVIVENIFRYMQMGHSRLEAARLGAAEVAWPVIASTATTVAAFAPLLAWQGVMGEFMKYLPKTLIIVLTCSLFVALIINPVMAAAMASVKKRRKSTGENEDGEHVGIFTRAYSKFLRVCLSSSASRTSTLLVSIFSLVVVFVLYGKYNYGVDFFPDADPKRAMIKIKCPQGTNIYQVDRIAREVESRVLPLVNSGEIEHLVSSVGGPDITFLDQESGPNIATLTLVFHDYADRSRTSIEYMSDIRKLVAGIPGADIKVERENEGPPTGAPVSVRISGDDFDTLADISEQAMSKIRAIPGIVNLRSTYDSSRPELQFTPDRKRAMLLGINTGTIGNFLKTAVFGSEVSIYRQFNDEFDITVRLPLENRRDVAEIYRLRIPDATGNPVPLRSLGRFEYKGGMGRISRVDQNRVITLNGDVDGVLAGDALKKVKEVLADINLPQGYSFRYVGENQDQDEAAAFLTKAFMIAILAIVMILVMQFNTLGVPFIIMVTVILSLVGVLIGLMVTATPFVIIMTGIGVMSLAGVVVNNAIVLLDYTRQLEQRGMELVDAAVHAGMTRLRPVLLTAVTTILGLIPMATGIAFDFHEMKLVTDSESSQWWASMANAVIFGLGFATLLTLVVVPTMYTAIYSLLERFGMGGLRIKPSGADAETASE